MSRIKKAQRAAAMLTLARALVLAGLTVGAVHALPAMAAEPTQHASPVRPVADAAAKPAVKPSARATRKPAASRESPYVRASRERAAAEPHGVRQPSVLAPLGQTRRARSADAPR